MKKITNEQEARRQVMKVSVYLAKSGITAGAISILLSYFMKLPAEVASALAVVLFGVVNSMLVYYEERK